MKVDTSAVSNGILRTREICLITSADEEGGKMDLSSELVDIASDTVRYPRVETVVVVYT